MLKYCKAQKTIFCMLALYMPLTVHGHTKNWVDTIKSHVHKAFVSYPNATKCGALLAGCGVLGALYWYYKRPLVFSHNFNGSMPHDVYSPVPSKNCKQIVQTVLTNVRDTEEDTIENKSDLAILQANDSYYQQSVSWLNEEVRKYLNSNEQYSVDRYADLFQAERLSCQIAALKCEKQRQEMNEQYQPLTFKWETCCQGIIATKQLLTEQDAWERKAKIYTGKDYMTISTADLVKINLEKK